MKYLWVVVIGAILVLCVAIFGPGKTVSREYIIAERPDGGYSLNAVIYKRYLITADGIFTGVRRTFTIVLIGKGRDLSYRNQKGYYYSLDEIKSTQKEWDLGYAWISDNHKYLYLNLFWVKAPDSVTPADVNGRYKLQTSSRE